MEKELAAKDLKNQEQEGTSESSKSRDDEQLELALRSWADLPTDILQRITSRLFLADRIRIPAVCKNWQTTPIPIPANCRIEPPWFVSLSKDDGLCTVFDSSSGRTYRVSSPKLIGACIHISKFGWLLLSKVHDNITSLFFFNPLRGDVINLPCLRADQCTIASFSEPPTSSHCLVCIINRASINSFDVYVHKQAEWSHHRVRSIMGFFLLPHSPVIQNGHIFCAGLGGMVGIFSLRDLRWCVRGSWIKDGLMYSINFVAEGDRRVFLVTIPVSNKPIRILMLGHPPEPSTEVMTLPRTALFVSPTSALLAAVGTGEMDRKVHYPVCGPPCQCERIGHYSMDSREYYPSQESSLPMEINKFTFCRSGYSWAWMEPKP